MAYVKGAGKGRLLRLRLLLLPTGADRLPPSDVFQTLPGHSRANPRPKAPQPQGPPDRDARGFTMGRGRSLPLPPNQSPTAPCAPGTTGVNRELPISAQADNPPGMDSPRTLLPNSAQVDTSIGNSLTDPLAASATAGSLGQQLLAQLHGQGATSSNASASASASASGSDLGRGLLQQLQLGSGANPAGSRPTALPNVAQQLNAGRALLEQLQRSPGQVANPQAIVSSAQQTGKIGAERGNSDHGSIAPVPFEQLLRSAAASQQHRTQTYPHTAPEASAPTVAQATAQPLVQPTTVASDGSGALMSFEQLLRAAAASQAEPRQTQTLQPPPAFRSSHQPATASAPAATALPPAAFQDPGRLLLQQLQQQGLQQTNFGQQQPLAPSAFSSVHQQATIPIPPQSIARPAIASTQQQAALPSQLSSADQAGRLLLQQLQRVSVSDAPRADVRAPAGAIANALQPEPSAPPAPTSVLLQNAADAMGRLTGADHSL